MGRHRKSQRLSFFDPPSTPSPTPEQIDNSVQYVLLSFICKNAHKVWSKNLRIDMVFKI